MSKKEWTEMGKKAGWLKQSDYDTWKTTPDDYYDSDGPYCPECDEEMVEVSSDVWECPNEDCNGYIKHK